MSEEKPRMALSNFREHCDRVQAKPIVHLIDRVLHLTVAAEKAMTQLPCLCNSKSVSCPKCELGSMIEKHGYQEPLP